MKFHSFLPEIDVDKNYHFPSVTDVGNNIWHHAKSLPEYNF